LSTNATPESAGPRRPPPRKIDGHQRDGRSSWAIVGNGNARTDAQMRRPVPADFNPKGATMSMTGLEVFDETVHKTNTWLKEIGNELGLERHGAYHVLRAVLHCLRDRLIINEAAQLGDQLPMLVRGIYYEAWHPAGKLEKIRSREEFLAMVADRLSMKQPIDPGNAVRAVFQTLENHVTAGEIRHVIQEMPEHIRELWPPLEAAHNP
jgi:uncharacterized protein (DUF2267 family)